jgi:hypothetical protein
VAIATLFVAACYISPVVLGMFKPRDRRGPAMMRRLLAGFGIVALSAIGLGAAVSAASGAAVAAAVSPSEFGYTGAAQSFLVPAGVCELTVDAAGASGGHENFKTAGDAIDSDAIGPLTDGIVPGHGGRVQATVPGTPGETLAIYVGGQGGDATATASATLPVSGPLTASATAVAGVGGFNGGADGGHNSQVYFAGDTNDGGVAVAAASAGGGGGGTSDVRRGGNVLADRVLVAGGGGGAGAEGVVASVEIGFVYQQTAVDGGPGGSGNGLNGSGGTGTGPGAGGVGGAGSLGVGGTGGANSGVTHTSSSASVAASAGGGGGGGLSGGGGGGTATITGGSTSGGGGGGGGGTALGPLGGTFTNDFQTGNGYVTITPAAPGLGCAPTLQVKKVVSGTSTGPFTEQVNCTAPTNPTVQSTTTVDNVDLVFHADGSPDSTDTPSGWVVSDGTWQFHDDVLIGSTCTVTETVTSGATSVSYACAWTPGASDHLSGVGCPGASSGPSKTPASVTFEGNGDSGLLTVTNTFTPAPATVAPATAAATPAAAVAVAPKFTG